jgi:hypothetical protein
VLSIVETDSTFCKEVVRGDKVWVRRCPFGQAKLVVPPSGEADRRGTEEHTTLRLHGGSDDARKKRSWVWIASA